MQINFTGDFTVRKTRQHVYEFLTDPERFCPILPDFKAMTREDDGHFTVTVSVGISHIRSDAKMKMKLAEVVAPSHAAYVGKGDVVAATVTMSAAFDLEDAPEGTKVVWKGDAQIVGSLVSLAGGLLEPLAKRNLTKLIDTLQAALSDDKQAVRA